MAPPKKASKWEKEEEEETSSDESVEAAPIVAPRRKFEDEEDSEDVADNWEEEEDSEVEREKAKKAAAAKAKADAEAAANKKSKAQRVEEHREAQRKKRLEEEDESDEEEEDEADKRTRLRQTEQAADLKHAEDLFANVGLGPKTKAAPNKALIIEDASNPGQTIDLSTLPLFKPATKSQFENLSATLIPLLTASASKPHYSIWIQNFIKQICTDLPSTEIKKASSALAALGNEKLKEEKAAEKGGTKKTKAAKSKSTLAGARDVGRGVADTTAYDDDALGDDDFM